MRRQNDILSPYEICYNAYNPGGVNMNVVQIKNELNILPLKDFSAIELNLFFSLCAKLRNEDTKKVRFTLTELKELSNYKSTSQTRFVKDLETLYDKILQVTYKVGNDQHFKKFTLFTDYEVNVYDNYLDVSVNENFIHLLNNFELGNFTIFELNELTSFKSNYTKNLYRLLKQFKSTGYLKISMKDFRERLSIPASYRMSDINKRILSPSLAEFEQVFFNIKVKKIKRNREVSALEFTFLPQKNIKPVAANNKGDNNAEELQFLADSLHLGDNLESNPLYSALKNS